ncbi:LamG-like jellyroll fold domain-containing protein [Rhodopirellula sp. JC639]|uniref:LamG-like jellyroll fold domain-containing protein n=1 Tax=Stieleria mannarensis TaxID=2755585 RepID=UPI00160272C5|nr:LamG-like jellyroll fold domain-containing protein [Rhodopirellula sp. JC639]
MPVDDDFIDRILEGEASDEEAAEFKAWLLVPENLQRYAFRAELHSDLRRSLRRRHIQKSALEASTDGTVADSASLQERLPSPIFTLRQMLVLTVTGLVTAACILITFVWPEGKPAPGDAYTATVVSKVNGLLTKDASRWDDMQIPVGDYELQKGLLNLQFGGGVMVYFEAPARFEAVSDRRIVLHSGRLSARVPPEGIGFTVETPEAEVVDFGTEFSVDVEGGASEVHVFDGLVRVHPGASNQRDVSRSVDLQASQALRITDGATKPEDISIATDRFIRNFDEPRLNYARLVKRLSPLVYYRMPIRDRGLVSEPPEYSGVVLTGEGKRPPHARGVFVGGSLRVGADSTGRGGRIDSPPALRMGRFSLTVFVYLEAPVHGAMVATNLHDGQGNFGLSLDENGLLRAAIRSSDGNVSSIAGGSVLPQKTWRHVVVTADGEQLQFYEDGKLVASTPCESMAASDSDTVWFGTDAEATRVWDGRLDEVALFDRALNEEEIATLYRTAQEEIARSQ